MAFDNYSEQLLIAAEQNTIERNFWLKQLSGRLHRTGFPHLPAKTGSETGEAAIAAFEFNAETTAKLIQSTKASDRALNLVLNTAVSLLLYKYTGSKDIITGMPIYRQETEGDFINTVLALRNPIDNNISFKEFLSRVRHTISDAVKHQNYPLEILVKDLDIDAPEEEFPLFDTAVLLENIHSPDYLAHIPCNMIFSFKKESERILGLIRYNSHYYDGAYIEKLTVHFKNLLASALFNPDLLLPEIEIFSPEEKEQLLLDSTGTAAPYPAATTIHKWFEQQAAKTPDRTAVSYPMELGYIYDQLEAETPDPRLEEKIAACCFKLNPYIYRSSLQIPGENGALNLFKTHRHNSVLTDNNLAELLGVFGGQSNLASIHRELKKLVTKNGGSLEFLMYTMSRTDLLEVTFRFNSSPEIFTIDTFGNFLELILCLYRNHLLELVGVTPGDTDVPGLTAGRYIPGDVLPRDISLEDTVLRATGATGAQVLLLGDTPGTATTGLLYLASYLKRHGIAARCQSYDPAVDYESMKANLDTLLEAVKPEVVAISMKWFLYTARVLDMAEIVKEYARQKGRDIRVVIGGNTASYYSREIIKNDRIDYLVRGDGEVPLLKIARGEKDIPNCLYRDKETGEIVESPITYIQDEADSREIYLSDMDDILVSKNALRFGTFFIYTHKGCAMNCLYCGGCNRAQQKTFNRKNLMRRGVAETRKDILAAREYTSTFHFEFDVPDKNIEGYCREIWEGIDLSGHFCIFSTLMQPSPQLIRLLSQTFAYVYWDYDVCTLSQRHREQLVSLGLVKPQPSDEEILTFMSRCETYDNIEVRPNLITGLPYFKEEDFQPGEKLLSRIIDTYTCFGELHWARLHAQPGAPITRDADRHHMHTYAATFEDFLKYSRENFNRTAGYATVESFNYPYIYYKEDRLNSRVTNFYLETNRKLELHNRSRKRGRFICETLTYRQLNEKAQRLAAVLTEKGVGPGAIVGLMLARGTGIPVGILGILKAGGAYMPIDPEFPVGRVRYMLSDSCAAALVTTRDAAGGGEGVTGWNGASYFLEDLPAPQAPAILPLHREPSAEDPVYVIYTSGTTGKPKGVVLEHRNLVNYVQWFSSAANLTPGDKTVLTSSFAFDLGYTSLFTSLLNGGELHILPRETYLLGKRLVDYIRDKGITYLKMTPSLFSVLVNTSGFSQETGGTLRVAAIGGEPIDVTDIETAHHRCPQLRTMNHYGPTEATIGCIFTYVDFQRFEEYKKTPVIGKPIQNSIVYILGKDQNPLPAGVPGELCLSGGGLARGYLNRPELTEEKFVELNRSYGAYRTYKTGDLAKRLEDGSIEFLGRIDTQVKVRGYRIELGEIEGRLRKHAGVEDALAVVKEPGEKKTEEKYICAYFVPSGGMSGAGEKKPDISEESQKEDIQQALSIVTRFGEHVAGDPEKVIVKTDGQSMTYRSLDREADRLARKIAQEYDDSNKLSKRERVRYKRQILLHRWGLASQEKLKSTTVFVAGAGGGASPTVMQLLLAGFGNIIICDFDEVELSNLNRQFLHDESRLGMNKALSAKMTINRMNPHINVIPRTEKLTEENVAELVGDASIIFDMFDGLESKFILSRYAAAREIPHVISAMADINSYSTVFHTPHTPCYHCIFDKDKWQAIVSGMEHYMDNYQKNPLPVVATSLFSSTSFAVNEAIKIILGFETPAYNKFMFFNQRGTKELGATQSYKAMTFTFSDHFRALCSEQGFDWDVGWRGKYLEEFDIKPNPGCPVCAPGAVEKIKKEFPATVPPKTAAPANNNRSMQTVAALLDRGDAISTAIMGTLKVDKTYVPLDPAAARDRLSYILEDCEARIILTCGGHLELAEKLRDSVNKNIKVIDMDNLEEPGPEAGVPGIDISRDRTACMVYSPLPGANSGPGGQVKGFFDTLLTGNGPFTFDRGNDGDVSSLPMVLREYLAEELPDYMVPSYFVPLDKIPLTPNGKVDRNSLPEPRSEAGDRYTAPANETERKLAQIWSAVLGLEQDTISTDANFFQLGGHSLNATVMVSKVQQLVGVNLNLGDVFKTPTIRGLAENISTMGEEDFSSIEPVPQQPYYPASSAQRRMYILKQLKGEETTSDSIPQVLLVEGDLDKERLEKILWELIKRHETLRTSFEVINDDIVQKVVPLDRLSEDLDFNIGYKEADEAELPGIIQDFIRPFDLGKAPLFRLNIVTIGQEKYIMMFDIHHIITDGTSSMIFKRDFIHLYNNVKLPELKIQYRDFSAWQNRLLESGIMKKQEKYWLEVFPVKEDIPLLDMPTDFPRPPVQVYEGETLLFDMSAETAQQIRALVTESGATLFMVFLAIYNILLSKYSGQEDIVVGVPVQGRQHPDLENAIGFFVNTLAIRNVPARDKSFAEFFEEVKINALDAYDNQDYQFEKLVERLGIDPDPSRHPLFSVMLQHINIDASMLGMENAGSGEPGLRVRPYEFENTIIQFDLLLHLIDYPEKIGFELLYSTKLFKRETIDNLINHFLNIAGEVARSPHIKLSEIKMFQDRPEELELQREQEKLDQLDIDLEI